MQESRVEKRSSLVHKLYLCKIRNREIFRYSFRCTHSTLDHHHLNIFVRGTFTLSVMSCISYKSRSDILTYMLININIALCGYILHIISTFHLHHRTEIPHCVCVSGRFFNCNWFVLAYASSTIKDCAFVHESPYL